MKARTGGGVRHMCTFPLAYLPSPSLTPSACSLFNRLNLSLSSPLSLDVLLKIPKKSADNRSFLTEACMAHLRPSSVWHYLFSSAPDELVSPHTVG